MENVAASTQLRRNLRAIHGDGVAFSVMVGTGEAYLPAFALVIGLGEVAAGLIATVPMLVGAVLQLISPAAVARLGSHKNWVVICAFTQAASFVPLLGAALLGAVPAWALFLIAGMYWGAGLATGPAWNTWVETLVPRPIRAAFFAGRTRAAQMALLLSLVGGGLLLEFGARTDRRLLAFAALFAAAGACRVLSATLLSRQSEPNPLPAGHRAVSIRELFRRVGRHGDLRLLLYMISVQLVIQISGPYFTPYMLGQLKLPYLEYFILLAASYLAKILVLPHLAGMVRRIGAQRALWFGGLGIVPLSALWLIGDSFTYLLLVQLVAGSMWAVYELATFLLLFETIPQQERTSVLTTYNFVNAMAMLAGSLVGGAILAGVGTTQAGYFAVFAASAGARLLTLIPLSRVTAMVFEPVPIILRTIASRPQLGSIDVPILASIDKPERDGQIESIAPAPPRSAAENP